MGTRADGFGNSFELADFSLRELVPVAEREGFAVASNVRSAAFEKDPRYRDVTRDADDTIVHVHDHHVLLMRDGETVPDDTLICEYAAALRALAKAALETDVARKIELAHAADARVADYNENLARSFSFLATGLREDAAPLIVTGHGFLRGHLNNPYLLRANVKYDVFRTLVRAQRDIPVAARAVVAWDAGEVDALVIGAGTGHARSVLHVDPDAATDKELRHAMGTAKPPVRRGLHYAAFAPRTVA